MCANHLEIMRQWYRTVWTQGDGLVKLSKVLPTLALLLFTEYHSGNELELRI